MLPKKERLTKSDFVGQRPRIIFRGTFVDIATMQGKNEGIPRFSCVIAKKRVKKSVDRNTIKRKVYHTLVNNKPKNPYLIIIYPKANCLTSSHNNIKEEISQAFATL
jgi:ribonuclease P protein component